MSTMWGSKAERFPSPEKQTRTFNTFSEYLRYQFQLSKNASSMDILADMNMTKRQMDSPPASTSPKPFTWKGTKSLKVVVPDNSYFDTNEVVEERKSKPRPLSATGRKKHGSTFADLKPPGPGQYHVTPTLLKPSFNRQFNGTYPEPKFDTNKSARDAPIMPLMTNNRTGAFLNATKYRSLSAPAGGREAAATRSSAAAAGSTSGGSPKQKDFDSNAVSNKHPAMLNPRYPPSSDKVIKRYSSVAAVSYVVPVPVPKKPCHETVLVPSPGKAKSQLFQ